MKIATYFVLIVEVISIAMETSCLPDKLRAGGLFDLILWGTLFGI